MSLRVGCGSRKCALLVALRNLGSVWFEERREKRKVRDPSCLPTGVLGANVDGRQ